MEAKQCSTRIETKRGGVRRSGRLFIPSVEVGQLHGSEELDIAATPNLHARPTVTGRPQTYTHLADLKPTVGVQQLGGQRFAPLQDYQRNGLIGLRAPRAGGLAAGGFLMSTWPRALIVPVPNSLASHLHPCLQAERLCRGGLDQIRPMQTRLPVQILLFADIDIRPLSNVLLYGGGLYSWFPTSGCSISSPKRVVDMISPIGGKAVLRADNELSFCSVVMACLGSAGESGSCVRLTSQEIFNVTPFGAEVWKSRLSSDSSGLHGRPFVWALVQTVGSCVRLSHPIAVLSYLRGA
ncbi:hypothetical protein CMUS01_13514 [Colletotrichum musicola]|uniref:Uncharacterized protein n=1 Tax=Colletotrichum musicola TaxID=2175873 RepID=A0A8H6JBT1_9PEZI|nr:hypothetical protein CMUS01_13514 [Colletotrichum musicola]